ncbi:MAG: RdgB/HAM1 family non-canonical purine NTP pyrophosphatase [Pseudomonadota bacterium]
MSAFLLNHKKLLIASHNHGKVHEFNQLFLGLDIELFSADDFNLIEPEETGQSFAENALLKAKIAAQATGLPAIGDDSGLSVEALGGEPGIYSARWAITKGKRDFRYGMDKIWKKIAFQPNRRAFFMCVLCLYLPNDSTFIFEGRIDGHITWPARGTNGFGYDPIFVPDGYHQTFGEIGHALKDKIGHRALAVKKLKQDLLK